MSVATYEVDCSRLRVPSAGLIAAGIALAHVPGSVGLPCPLRALTGIPCPFCGLTTGVRDLGSGHVSEASRTAPLALVVAAICLAAVVIPLPNRLRLPVPLLGTALLAEWLFELHRFHLL
jgi:hypothetical protein